MKRPSASFLAVALLLGTLATLYRTVGDLTTWSECLTVWPPFVWCAVVAPRVVLLAVRRQWRELVAALALLAGFLAVTVEWPRRLRPPQDSGDPPGSLRLRVVSWNVSGVMPLEELAALSPDLCLLQEIGGISEHLLSGYWAGWRWSEGFDPGVLSRFPATRPPTRKVGPWTEPQVLRLELPGGRALVVVNVRLVLPAIVVAAASFETPIGIGQAHQQRLRQFEELAALLRETLVRQSTPSALLCGDFNTPGAARSLAPLAEVVQDVWSRAGVGWGGTMTAELPVSRIDQCWATADIRPLEARVVRGGSSDHRALVVELRLDGNLAPRNPSRGGSE